MGGAPDRPYTEGSLLTPHFPSDDVTGAETDDGDEDEDAGADDPGEDGWAYESSPVGVGGGALLLCGARRAGGLWSGGPLALFGGGGGGTADFWGVG